MKILHTADWHLGQKLYGYDRTEEQLSFLNRLADIVHEHKPDVMVVCGDIFHVCNPSTEVQTMFVNALLHIQRRYPPLNVVITAGNHDSYSRLEIDKQLWQQHRIHVIGNIARNDDYTAHYEDHIIDIVINNELVGYVSAVPYCFMQNFPPVPEEGEGNRQNYFFRQLLQKVDTLNNKQLPVVLMAHLAVSGSDLTGHDMVTGGMEYTDIQDLGQGYDYLALGHIHCPQFIKGSNQRARYSGTPLPVSFNENYPHSVTMVEIEKHAATPHYEIIEIDNPRPLVTLPDKEELPFEEALLLLSRLDAQMPAYVRMNVLVKAGELLLPDSFEKAAAVVKNKQCRFCIINKITEEGAPVVDDTEEYDIDKLQTLSDENIIDIVQKQALLTADEENMLREVVMEIKMEQRSQQ